MLTENLYWILVADAILGLAVSLFLRSRLVRTLGLLMIPLIVLALAIGLQIISFATKGGMLAWYPLGLCCILGFYATGIGLILGKYLYQLRRSKN